MSEGWTGEPKRWALDYDVPLGKWGVVFVGFRKEAGSRVRFVRGAFQNTPMGSVGIPWPELDKDEKKALARAERQIRKEYRKLSEEGVFDE